MKRLSFVAKAAMLFVAGCFLSCGDVTNENYPTTTIGSLNVTANAYQGVNVITWNAVKDAESYSVYKSVNGGREFFVESPADMTFIDTDIEQNVSYRYRIIAHPIDTQLHDAAQKEVTLKTKSDWASAGSSFLDLSKNEGGTTLSGSTISASLLSSSGSTVRVKFPVKSYAKYTVKVGQPGGASLNESAAIDSAVTVNGFDYAETATVDVTALFSGVKEVTIVATPYSNLYTSSTVKADGTVTVSDFSKIPSATAGEITAKWTAYYNPRANARISFSPASLDGKKFNISDYKVYRAIPDSSGTGNLVYSSITELYLRKDVDASTTNTTVYYCDDNLDISAVSKVYYYVVLTYNGQIKVSNIQLAVPGSSDDDWNFYPGGESSSSSSYIQNLIVDESQHLNVDVYASNGYSAKFTYGSFSTYNQALVAVESELSYEVSLSYNQDPSGYYRYYSGKSDNYMYSGYYYAFRFVDGDSVHKIIAYLRFNYDDDIYYLEMKYGRPNGYSEHLMPEITTISKEFDQWNYNSVTLDYSVSGSSSVYYRIYRATSTSGISPDDSAYNRITTTTSTQYEDTSMYSVGQYLFYKVEAVNPYTGGTTKSEAKFVCALQVPWGVSATSLSDSTNVTVTWYYNDDKKANFEIYGVSGGGDTSFLGSDTSNSKSWTGNRDGFSQFSVKAYYDEVDSTGATICSKMSSPVTAQPQSQ